MNPEELITTEEICTRYHVERTFIAALSESGIIEVVKVEEKEYVHFDTLGEFEKMMRLHRDLEINPPGLAAVQHLLGRLHELERLNRELRNRLDLYE
ncbi:MAG: chaperone modulator CbpM [Salegentibacter sp.]